MHRPDISTGLAEPDQRTGHDALRASVDFNRPAKVVENGADTTPAATILPKDCERASTFLSKINVSVGTALHQCGR